MKKKLVPLLRFPEFIGNKEWALNELGKYLDYLQPTKYLVSSTVYDDKFKIPVLTAGKTFILGYTNEDEGIFDKNLPVIIFDDFTTASKYVDFPFKAKSSAMKILLAKHNANIKFFYESMQLIKYQIGVHERHWISIFSKIEIPVPMPNEQQKIANCLSSIDDLITAENQKLEVLKIHKKGLIQLLFPVEGKNVPKLRFSEFLNHKGWVVKPFGKVFDRLITKNTENNKNVLTISAQQGLVNQLDYFNKTIAANDITGYYLLHKGDFAYNKSYSKGYPMGAIKRLNMYDKGVVSTLYICFRTRENYHPPFFEHYFESGLINPEIQKIAQEGSRAHGLLNVSIQEFFKKISIYVPDFKEQQKIANCLSSIDALITMENQKLEALKSHKKGLMQQLFPVKDKADS